MTSITAMALGVAVQSAAAAAYDPGPAVGAEAPRFEATDQEGRARRFEDLRGPNGLALLFFRSADW